MGRGCGREWWPYSGRDVDRYMQVPESTLFSGCLYTGSEEEGKLKLDSRVRASATPLRCLWKTRDVGLERQMSLS